jgi:hypothetical protein
MPSLRRRCLARREYTADEISQLLTGHEEMGGTGFGCAFRCEIDLDAANEAWQALRDELLPEFIAEHPGQRPWAWWAFDAPERRRRLDGVHPFDIEGEFYEKCPDRLNGPWPPECPMETWFGLPSPHRFGTFGEYESERQYLTRLNLLTQNEKQE